MPRHLCKGEIDDLGQRGEQECFHLRLQCRRDEWCRRVLIRQPDRCGWAGNEYIGGKNLLQSTPVEKYLYVMRGLVSELRTWKLYFHTLGGFGINYMPLKDQFAVHKSFPNLNEIRFESPKRDRGDPASMVLIPE